MSCERYWREGIVLVERGLDDPHRDGCEDCRRAHASRQELIEALPLIGAGETGDPHWQVKVWQRIDGERARAPWRWRWQLADALTVVCVAALWIGLCRGRPDDVRPQDDVRPRIEIIAEGGPMRSSAAHVDDRLKVTVAETSDVWIYRGGRLALHCPARQALDGCAPDAHGMIVEMLLSIPGTYQVIVTATPVASPPRGRLDEDRAALETAGVSYKEDTVQVR
jgi:hypothetical protein